jgi:hypothetical protein
VIFLDKIFFVGEMVDNSIKPDDIPVSDQVDLEKLLEGDDDPLQVVVYIESGFNQSEDKYYTKDLIRDVVEQVNNNTVNGHLGHRKDEELDTEFPLIATHWIGAEYKESGDKATAYIRGYVDPSQPELKRWVRTGRIKQVSILGVAMGGYEEGIPHIHSIELKSIDWTPLNQNGMSAGLVVAEMEGKPEKNLSENQSENQKKGDDNNMKLSKSKIEEVVNSVEGDEVSAEKLVSELELDVQEKKQKKTEEKNEKLDEVKQVLELDEEADTETVQSKLEEVVGLASEMKTIKKEETIKNNTKKVENILEKEINNETIKSVVSEMVSNKINLNKKVEEAEVKELVSETVESKAVQIIKEKMFSDNPVEEKKNQKESENTYISFE